MNTRQTTTATYNCEPAFGSWASVLRGNVNGRSAVAAAIGEAPFRTMRRELISAAREFTQTLHTIASAEGIDFPQPPLEFDTEGDFWSAERPIVATGHQPIVFHPGILAKNLRLQQLLSNTNAGGLMILIDTDEGVAGKFVHPVTTENGVALKSVSLSNGMSLYQSQTVTNADAVAQASQSVTSALLELGFPDAADRTAKVMAQYAMLAGESAVIANSIVRRHWEGCPAYLELPLSKIASLPSVKQFFVSLIADARRLHATYNATLSDYRQEHRIQNMANPFPDLSVNGDQIELPFWIVDTVAGTRRVLTANLTAGQAELQSHELLVPRGMMITTFLRLVASDLFIHGTGGAKYDQCTDRFIHGLFGVNAPEFTSTTTTRHLFVQQLQQIEKAVAAQETLRDIHARFQKHTQLGTFTGDDQTIALSLLRERSETVARLKQAKSAGESAMAINTELKAINARIRKFVDDFGADVEDVVRPSPEQLKVLQTRHFPFFFFEKQNSAVAPVPNANRSPLQTSSFDCANLFATAFRQCAHDRL